MLSRRSLLTALPALGAASGRTGTSSVVSFGVIADCQHADKPDDERLGRHYRLSLQKLREAVDGLNRPRPDFVVNLGDAIDEDHRSYEAVLPIFRELKAPLLHVLGNHDYAVGDEWKTGVPARFGLEDTWGSFRAGGWRFLRLDGNEISLFAHPAGSPAWRRAREVRAAFSPEPADYNGAISSRQLAWMEEEIGAARAAGERVVIFCHYPIWPENPHNLWNWREVGDLLLDHRRTVAAWMNGHNHAGGHAERDGVHFLTFRGMVDTTENAWAEVRLSARQIEVIGHGRESCRRLPLAPS